MAVQGDKDFEGLEVERTVRLGPNNNNEETMHNGEVHYSWRFESKLVAFVTLSIGSFGLLMVAVATATWIYISVQMKRGYLNEDIQNMIPGLEPDTENQYLSVGFAVLLLAAGVAVTELCAAFVLRRATEENEEQPHENLKRCLFWRNVNIFLLILTCTSLVKGYDLWYTWLWITLRYKCLLLVWMHIRELKQESQKLASTKQKYESTCQDIITERT